MNAALEIFYKAAVGADESQCVYSSRDFIHVMKGYIDKSMEFAVNGVIEISSDERAELAVLQKVITMMIACDKR